MTGGIYLFKGEKQLIEMTEQAYDSEALLQELLEEYPALLAGDQIDSNAPRRWLLISRETGVPDSDVGINRWSVDHLFLDQDAVPTLIEVKRSSDTRIRREVVGQMLDYAANAVKYWPAEKIRSEFEDRCWERGEDPSQFLSAWLDSDADLGEFWQRVKTNLEAGKVRMLFVADIIPTELQRIIEFLNEQMDPAEVLAVQVKQYVGEGHTTMVPRVIGQTAKAMTTKSGGSRPKRKWDEPSFFAKLTEEHGPEEAKIARSILEWAHSNNIHVWWGEGTKIGSFFPLFDYDNETYWTVSVWTSGTVEIQFQMMIKEKYPFSSEAMRAEMRKQFNMIPGINIPENALSKRPSIKLTILKDGAVLKQFLAVLDWMISEIKKKPVATSALD